MRVSAKGAVCEDLMVIDLPQGKTTSPHPESQRKEVGCMGNKQQLLTDEEISKAVWGQWSAEHLRVAQAQLSKARKHYEAKLNEVRLYYKDPEYDPQAREFGWFLSHSWRPPEEIRNGVRNDH